jgi:hypothetical protein
MISGDPCSGLSQRLDDMALQRTVDQNENHAAADNSATKPQNGHG